jgi:tetratricopeptide (TPR) repeat protein
LYGIATLRNKTTLKEEIIDQVSLGNWSEALHCYENAIQLNPNDIETQLNILNCLLNLGYLTILKKNVDGILNNNNFNKYNNEIKLEDNENKNNLINKDINDKNYNELINICGLKSSWRLCDWKDCEKFLIDLKNNKDFEVGLVKSLLYYKNEKKDEFFESIKETKKNIVEELSVASIESYEVNFLFNITEVLKSII